MRAYPWWGVTLGNAGSANNSQCSVSGLGSSFTANGDTLTITLALDFNVGFGGHKIVFLAARDGAAGNSGWQPLGTWTIVGASPPAIASPTVGPTHGGGSPQTFMFTFTDSAGWQDISIVNILINGALDGHNACYLAYSRAINALYLVDDAGGSLLPGIDPNGAGTVSNSQCTVSGGVSAVTGTGNVLTLTLSFQFNSAFAGNRILYAATRTSASTSNWQARWRLDDRSLQLRGLCGRYAVLTCRRGARQKGGPKGKDRRQKTRYQARAFPYSASKRLHAFSACGSL